ncbi:MAG TPA: type 1 glutamine amidotransferase domain-containing protein [Candidatus Saccharimonadales bacterium]
MADLTGKKIAVVVDDYFEQAEFTGPIDALRKAGAEVEVVATERGTLQGLNHVEKGDTFEADLTLDEADRSSYVALVLPGGAVNADTLRMNEIAQTWVKEFLEANKPVAAICHAPWLLVSAGVASGRALTSFETIQDDMRNAGAKWSDQEVVVDGSLITSRKPDDIPAFNEALIDMLSA